MTPAITEPSPVQDHDVPIFTKDKKAIQDQGHWDLTTQQVTVLSKAKNKSLFPVTRPTLF